MEGLWKAFKGQSPISSLRARPPVKAHRHPLELKKNQTNPPVARAAIGSHVPFLPAKRTPGGVQTPPTPDYETNQPRPNGLKSKHLRPQCPGAAPNQRRPAPRRECPKLGSPWDILGHGKPDRGRSLPVQRRDSRGDHRRRLGRCSGSYGCNHSGECLCDDGMTRRGGDGGCCALLADGRRRGAAI